ncbi:PEP-CTERM/exosortase system-associated acyltransferase [Lacimicrobium alkaliphilum]|uniref:PEP-CTERM/exosortase system-associated acyltransferase n=1 Tax=Lacimicrobium alkaliphilum TaxID=1526571 RepID=UPI000AABF76A|nr:PEP-CTERM/exosortase system-associated acyltransferase [Lacimicrobium alkaliphilum]
MPFIGPVARVALKFFANREAGNISAHFARYLRPRYAGSEALQATSFRMRHQVYCEELKFEPQRASGLETDDFDPHSYHCVIEHKPSGKFAGTVRIVYSKSADELLPIEKYCSEAISCDENAPWDFPRTEICEISRLAVPEQFRRRQMDKFKGAATGVINEESYSEAELRCFPFIAVGLYMAAASIALEQGINHCFVMMEPRLARSLRLVGIPFKQIGPVVDYHGERAPYYINRQVLLDSLPPGFKKLLHYVQHEISSQLQDAPIDTSAEKTNTRYSIEKKVPSFNLAY